MSNIVIIDDDQALCRSLQIQLRERGHDVEYANRGGEGLKLVAESSPDLVLLDLALPDGNGLGFLNTIKTSAKVPVAMITGQQEMKATIEAMRLGAVDYIRKPFELDDVLLLLEKIERRDAAQKDKSNGVSAKLATEERHEIVGADRKMTALVKEIGLLSRTNVTVLIEGESGTGKELFARALHEASSPDSPFVAINCSAVVPTLLESELFGHEKGAFTGADRQKRGKLEAAGQGTLFLDEIGDMTIELQAKLLRVLQEKEFERVGGIKPIPFNARVIAATNRDLKRLVEEEKFREDLLFRLAVSHLVIPPLRERRGDIRKLLQHLLAQVARDLHRDVEGVDEKAMRSLETYDWPGNVRELENVLTRAVALSQGSMLTSEDLESSLNGESQPIAETGSIAPLRDAEKQHIEKALTAMNWNITQTAKALEVSPTTLRKKIGDYNLRR